VDTLRRFASGSAGVLANRDCPVLRDHFEAADWWSNTSPEGVAFAAIAREESGDGTLADFYENGRVVGRFQLPLPGRHNLSNATGALAACRLQGVPFADLARAVAGLHSPGRRFDCRGLWRNRVVVDDYAHHPSEVKATLAMARLMVTSGRSPLPLVPRRVVAVFQPHRYSRTAQFLAEFAAALQESDAVLLAPLYAAGEAPISGISSRSLAEEISRLAPALPVESTDSLDQLARRVSETSRAGDLVLVMGAGDVNGLWSRLGQLPDGAEISASLLQAA
jgi:UDP-N-acetylmuramate--alanine ligase